MWPLWLERLGSHLRADKDHWIHKAEASEPTASQPVRLGLSVSLQTPHSVTAHWLTDPDAFLDSRRHVIGVTVTLTLKTL